MNALSKKIASQLLQSKAIKLEPANPFTWASGWKSPIYCDNRITLSFPHIRTLIRDSFADIIRDKFPTVDVIAGVATGAIAQAALVADILDLPMVYVRSEAKSHGLTNQIEGKITKKAEVVVIEDLVSTGKSSLVAVEALRNAGCKVLGMTAIFTYGFKTAQDNFENAHCKLYTLSNYQDLLDQAVANGMIKEDMLDLLSEWRKNPAEWDPSTRK